VTRAKRPPSRLAKSAPTPQRGDWVDYYYRGAKYRHKYKRATFCPTCHETLLEHIFYSTRFTDSRAPTLTRSARVTTILAAVPPTRGNP
jgi:hypothetical protein